ncbi:hypothetical protein BUALT_Bualt15G0112900 [Buddleja alternifolia]|uniref:INO80 complex subunit B-like conserved region domain-containing protein n=1 Tax=Buddleja alternifolia TaxID=168488 RepID=A0AAV6WMM1_9LAMI|nr:hypothetical protein BUALT_Bualt15G0112900 [Buddleja alternifolia]
MDDFGGVGLGTMSKTSKKRRSNLYRRPTNESECLLEYHDSVSLSSTPSDHVSDAPSEGTMGQNLNQCISRASYSNLADAETVHKSSDEDVVYGEPNDLKRSTEDKMSEMVVGGHHSGQSGLASDGIGMRNKLNKVKVKLKVGGVTHTIHAKSSSDGSSVAGTSDNNSTPSEAIYPPQKLTRQFGYLQCQCLLEQENLDLHFTGEKVGLRGVPWKDFSKIGFSFVKMDSFEVDVPDDSDKQSFKHGRLSKSKSIYKKSPSVEEYDEEDDEIRYLQKLKTSRIASFDNTDYEEESRGKKLRKISNVMNRNTEEVYALGDYDSSRSGKESKKSGSMKAYGDADYMEEEESVSDVEIELKNKKQRKESISISEFPNKESSVTTRRRAILSGKDIATGLGASSIQFPDGLPPAPPRKPKEQLTEVQQQLKRAEAAQRRKIQNEKAARESEAEAIRKILGQDSSRKRREEKFKKRQEELAQERSVNSARVAPDVVRWVIGPSGTVVTFPDEIGLPTIFEPKPSRYPSPREECAGPSCTNAYKYRDSKSNLPLCSLQCYKAIH